MERIQFIDEIATYAVEECKRRGYGDAQAWTCVCQAICESNYGRSNLMRNANAYFGIKASKQWVENAKYGGLVYSAKTKECYDGKTYSQITACFRAYRSMQDSVSDYFDLMESKRYRASLKMNTVKDCITYIKRAGYATSPSYIDTILSIFKSNERQITYHKVGDTSYVKPVVVETKTSCYPKISYEGDSIVDVLNYLGEKSDRKTRSAIAKANGIENYRGTAKQNKKMVELLVSGNLRRA